MVIEGAQEGFGEDISVFELVHDAFDMMKTSNTVMSDTSPHHHAATAIFHCLLCLSGIVSLSWLSPTPLATI